MIYFVDKVSRAFFLLRDSVGSDVMSLRAKLYISFSVMILMVLAISVASLYTFTTTANRIETTKDQVQYVDRELIPESNIFSRISTIIASAGLRFYAYSYNAFDSDFSKGEENVKATRQELAAMEDLLAKAAPDHLPAARKNVPEIKGQLAALDAKSNELKNCIDGMGKYRDDVNARIANMDRIENELLKEMMDDLKNSFLAGNEKGEIAPVVQRRLDRVQVLDELSDALTDGQMLYWEAQSNFGEAADKIFRKSIAIMNQTADKAQAYLESPAIGTRESTKESFRNLVAEIRAYSKSIAGMANAWKESDRITGEISAISATVTAAATTMSGVAAESVLKQTGAIADATVHIDATVDSSAKVSWIIAVLSLMIGVLLAIFITRSITLPINLVIERLSGAEKALANASSQVGEAAHELADGSSEQAAAIEETSSALEQMSSMTRQNADNATLTNTKTQATAKLVAEGSASMQEMSGAMAEISDKSDRISQIIKTIEDISFQTNLLALNAAVEAARAGEAGKGFAVVADEVRNLSQRSAQAARDTSDLINSSVESVRNGSAIVQKLSNAFAGIENGTSDIGNLIHQIANATNEQAQGVDQVNTAMAQMDKVTQQNSANAATTASSSTELGEQVTELQSDINLLLGIVFGRKAGGRRRLGGKTGGGPGGNAGRNAGRVAAGGRGNRMLPGPSSMVVKPDNVIPFDDE